MDGLRPAIATLALFGAALLPTAGALAAESESGASQCSWGLQSNPNTVNVEYPDLDAHYWGRSFVPVPGERLVISGEYPVARHFTYVTKSWCRSTRSRERDRRQRRHVARGGGVFPGGIVIYPNMLPAASFAEAIQHVPEESSPQAVMGDYFPQTVYCTKQLFEAGGWKACAEDTG